jgi:hypothetical protein
MVYRIEKNRLTRNKIRNKNSKNRSKTPAMNKTFF